MRCLVTGVAGFIGSHLAETLLQDGHEVCGIDAFIDYYPRSIKERNLRNLLDWDHFSFIEGNVIDVDLPSLLEGVQWIFHQAAQAGVRASWEKQFDLYVQCNILATQRLLEAARHSQSLRRFVYASSSSVYGNTKTLPVVESMQLSPYSPYGVTKLSGENLCSLYYHNFRLPTVSLRYFTVYGPRQRPDMAFHRFCKAALEHSPIQVFGDGYQTRDFTYISDVVAANIRAASEFDANGTVMNIAGGSRVTLNDAIRLLEEISGIPVDISFYAQQHGDVRDTFADISFAERTIAYLPQVSLKEGLAKEWEDIVSLYDYLHSTVSQ
jgi:nucleoside-diphosphate-sugar epimerase